MYVPMRDDDVPIQFRIPWDKNTAKGFGIALCILALILLISPLIKHSPPPTALYNLNNIPIEMLSFGEGDGTGARKGNLSEEGMAYKGKKPLNQLDDAQKVSKTKATQKDALTDPDQSSNLVPKSELSSDQNNNKTGSGSKNLGSPTGKETGTGLGVKGSGKGLGSGLGDIDWGGGGNRTVLYKKIPVYPPGANTNAQIRIRFTVARDGTIISMLPLQKGDPLLEKAAMDALRQWRFNPLKEDKIMFGIIPFTFKLK